MSDISNLSKILTSKPTDHNALTLSVSKVKTFKDCKAKYRYSYIEKLPKKDWEFLTFGKFLHEILETFYQERLKGVDTPHHILLTECYQKSYKVWKNKLSSDQTKECQNILKTFLKKVSTATDESATQVISVERPFYIDIDGKVLLNGFIDRIQKDPDGLLHVADYKTTKHKKYLKNDDFQLLTYAFVMCLEDPGLERVRTSYIMLRHDFDGLVKEYDREQIMSIEKTFLEYAEKIQAEKLFRPSPSNLCSFCDYQERCNADRGILGENSDFKFGATTW